MPPDEGGDATGPRRPAAPEGRGTDVPPVLLAFAEAPRSAVDLHILLTGIQTGPLALLADALQVLALGAYLVGVRRLRRRGRHWSGWPTAAYAAGVVALWIAVGSGLAAYDDVNVTLHVVQHVLLMMVAPPLVALGKPVTLVVQASGRSAQVRVLKVVRSHAVSALTFPVVAWLLYYGTMVVFFLTPAYAYSVAHPLFHDGTHLWFFAIGYLYWAPIVGLDPTRWRLSYPARIGSLFAGMPFEAFLGISLTGLPKPIAPINTLANTHTAGSAFWALAMSATGLCMAVVAGQWYRQLQRDTARQDRRAAEAAAANRARAAELGVDDLAEGVTVPWWRLAELEARQRRSDGPPG